MTTISEIENQIFQHKAEIRRLERQKSRTPESLIKSIMYRLYSGEITVTHNWIDCVDYYVDLSNAVRNNINGGDKITSTETKKLFKMGFIVVTVGQDYIMLTKLKDPKF